MARNRRTTQQREVQDYRHDNATRRNNPPAGIAAQGRIEETPKQEYAYNPHLPPILRSDPDSDVDELHELLQKAQHQTLEPEEAEKIANALKHHEPWLEWAGKQEAKSFTVDPVALHKHEHVSAKAILKVAARENVQRELFADPQQTYDQALEFYKHDVDWANRLILGDSLMVMSSLAHREDLAGKVQMIYIDPPYGIKFSSNFQPTVFQRDVKDRDQDLTREAEQIKAYRDTWTLGIHSYLAYLRDRLIVAKDLLTDSGSIFVQIGDENVHRVKAIMDEVFGGENHVSTICYASSIGLGGRMLDTVTNYIIWYAKSKSSAKYRQLFRELTRGETGATRYNSITETTFEDRILTKEEKTGIIPIDDKSCFFRQGLTSRSGGESTRFPVQFAGKDYSPTAGGWRTSRVGMDRVLKANRVALEGRRLTFKKYFGDFGCISISNFWTDLTGGIASRTDPKVYVVQTSTKIIERCLQMTTDPGDLVLDPTCGAGTTAYVAEQWGRRWITIDTSRVSIALARQRLLTASYEYYKLKDEENGVMGGFVNKTVPHITLRSIARTPRLILFLKGMNRFLMRNLRR